VIYVGFGQAFHEELGIGLMLMRIGGNACGLWVREGTPAFQIMISDIISPIWIYIVSRTREFKPLLCT
jgi:hypothetical protein